MLYIVRYANLRPGLAGHWDGPAWAQADTLEIAHFRPEGSDHRPSTQARLLYDEDNLYGIFRVQDRYVRCVHHGPQAPGWLDSCVETFIKPKEDHGYLNFEINCGGSLLCYYIVDPARVPGGFRDYTVLPTDDLHRVAIYHSLPERIEPEISNPVEWRVEFAIPLSLIEKWVGPLVPLAGQEWRANFFKCGDETSHPHWGSWAPLDAFDFHRPHCFGTIRFEVHLL